MLLGQVEHAGDHAGALHRVRGSQGTELATSTSLVLDSGYFSGEAHLGYHQDTHLGARGALRTLRVLSRREKTAHKARGFMGKPACMCLDVHVHDARWPTFCKRTRKATPAYERASAQAWPVGERQRLG